MNTKLNNTSTHSYFMNLALMQAKKILGNTKENPAVGCVIVKNNNVVSADHTSLNGRPHAEYNAIKHAKVNIKNSSLYVTLEPCSNFGKTPPCVNTIVKNKIKSVFFSLKDPDTRSFNKSSEQFKKKNINVQIGTLLNDIKIFYRSYINFKNSQLPFVTGKIAISRDFYTKNKKRKWITNEYSRGRVHLMRSNHDCILTGIRTIIHDNPQLNCRIHGLEDTSPSRIILDKKLKIPLGCNIIKSSNKFKTIIFYNKVMPKKIAILKKSNIKLIKFPLDRNGNFILKNILIKIKSLGYSRVFLESGLNLTTNFLDKNLINEFKLFKSNKKLGINGSNNFHKNIKVFFKNKKFVNEKINLFGDKLITYRIK